MDCSQVLEMLDAYALGASEAAEAKVIEEHVADCVRCWDELSSAQRTAALLALTTVMEQPPERVEQRIIAQAQRERTPVPVRTEPRQSFWRRVWSPWPATAGAFGIASVAALAVSGVLAMQMQDLRDENDDLESQLRATVFQLDAQTELTATQFEDQRTVIAVLSDEDREQVDVAAESERMAADATYTWSAEKHEGILVCENMPELPPGKVYQLWITERGTATPVRQFLATDGACQVTMSIDSSWGTPTGIGVSIENAPGGAERPTGGWLLYGHFD
jgi:hypothetical protein